MAQHILFITGNDTGVGKTVFSSLLTRHLVEKKMRVAALKPLCSGGRDDARLLREAAGKVLSLDEVNPWHFRATLSPHLAARQEGKRVTLHQVTRHIRRFQKQFDVLVVEGAGGLLSPLGEKFNSRDCLLALNATPIVVCPNRLGAINQVLLVLAALPESVAQQAEIVLMTQEKSDAAARTNVAALQEFVGGERVHLFPWFKHFPTGVTAGSTAVLEALAKRVFAQNF